MEGAPVGAIRETEVQWDKIGRENPQQRGGSQVMTWSTSCVNMARSQTAQIAGQRSFWGCQDEIIIGRSGHLAILGLKSYSLPHM